MHRLISSVGLGLVVVVGAMGCGNKKPAETAPNKPDTTSAPEDGDAGATSGAAAEPKKDDCVGFDIGDLETILSKSACEKVGMNPDSAEPVDMKGKLEVTVTASPSKVAPGGKADLLITFANKSKAPLTLYFRTDPVPRFEVEAYTAKGKRADVPAGNPPALPAGVSQPPPAEAKTAYVTLAANGTARVRRTWDAVKMKWAPEKAKGTPPEKGFPRKPAGNLGKGKYVIKVVTPLVGVAPDGEKEPAAPKTDIEVGS